MAPNPAGTGYRRRLWAFVCAASAHHSRFAADCTISVGVVRSAPPPRRTPWRRRGGEVDSQIVSRTDLVDEYFISASDGERRIHEERVVGVVAVDEWVVGRVLGEGIGREQIQAVGVSERLPAARDGGRR